MHLNGTIQVHCRQPATGKSYYVSEIEIIIVKYEHEKRSGRKRLKNTICRANKVWRLNPRHSVP